MKNAEIILEEKSVRITPMRQLLLEYFLKENKTIGLVDLEKTFPRADRITLYRSLKTFVDKGILHKVTGTAAEAKYALCFDCTENQHKDYHPHFQCTKCKKLECLTSTFIPSLPLPIGYQTTEISMLIKGLCPHCLA